MRTLILLLAIFLSGCLAAEKQKRPENSPAEAVYRSNCSLCHSLYPPNLYTYQQLEKYVKKFGRGLSAEERRSLLEYLYEASKKQ